MPEVVEVAREEVLMVVEAGVEEGSGVDMMN